MIVYRWGNKTCGSCLRADEVLPRVLQEFPDATYNSLQIRKDKLLFERYRKGVPLIYFEYNDNIYPYRGLISDTHFKLWLCSVIDGCVNDTVARV